MCTFHPDPLFVPTAAPARSIRRLLAILLLIPVSLLLALVFWGKLLFESIAVVEEFIADVEFVPIIVLLFGFGELLEKF